MSTQPTLKKFNDSESCTIIFKDSDSEATGTIKATMDVKTRQTKIELDFQPRLEPGSKPKLYAALALHFIKVIQGQ